MIGGDSMNIRAFVSSTFKDLEQHRRHVIEQLRKSGITVDPMEDWTSDADEPATFSQERVEGCHLCILLVGFRRGTVPDGQERSITQMEYDHARSLGIDILPFVLDDKVKSWPAEFDQRESDPSLKEWRSQVFKGHGVETFEATPTTLAIIPALFRWRDRRQRRTDQSDYLAALREAHGDIKFLGLPQLKDNQDIQIDRLFVNPYLAERFVSADASPADWPKRMPLLEELEEHRRLVILGDPGAGKSTLVNWIVWSLADEQPNEWKARLKSLIPIPLILRELKIGPGITWENLLEQFRGTSSGRHLPSDHLEQLLKKGDAFFLIDGLDEIGSVSIRRDLRDAVKSGMNRYKTCHWLFTSRIVGYEAVPFDREDDAPRWVAVPPEDEEAETETAKLVQQAATYSTPTLRYAAPFDDEQIARFVKHWYAEREQDQYKAKEGKKGLVDAIHRDPSTTRLARIPNLLTIMALIYRIRAKLPNGKALLYNAIAEAYLESIDDYRQLREDDDTLLDKKRWLSRIGFEMQLKRHAAQRDDTGQRDNTNQEILIEHDQLCRWVAEGMEETNRVTQEGDPARFIEHVKRRSGLLIERAEGEFTFTHLSFQEYFAACYLKDRFKSPQWIRGKHIPPGTRPDEIRQYANRSVWREAFVFLFELIANEEPDCQEDLWDVVFGGDWQNLATNRDAAQLVYLLARLSVNPHAGLSPSQTEECSRLCLRWELLRQQADDRGDWYEPSPVFSIYFSDTPHEQRHYLTQLAHLVRDETMSRLSLNNTGVSDLGPLGSLTSLQILGLNNTGVSDLGPLGSLTSLQILWLQNTGVSDLGPLGSLTSLQDLWLHNTGVSDQEIAAIKRALPQVNVRK